eukprot:SM000053S17474  [mRNA]  locus=s53:642499:644515:+ [translate_table: standard]
MAARQHQPAAVVEPVGGGRWDDVLRLESRVPDGELLWTDPRPHADCAEDHGDDDGEWAYATPEDRWRPLDAASTPWLNDGGGDAGDPDDGGGECPFGGGQQGGTLRWGGCPEAPVALWGAGWQRREAFVPTDHRIGALLQPSDDGGGGAAVVVELQERDIFRLLEARILGLPRAAGPGFAACHPDLRLGGLLHLVSVVLAVPAAWDVELGTQFREGAAGGPGQRFYRTRVLAALLDAARTSHTAQPLPPDAGGMEEDSPWQRACFSMLAGGSSAARLNAELHQLRRAALEADGHSSGEGEETDAESCLDELLSLDSRSGSFPDLNDAAAAAIGGLGDAGEGGSPSSANAIPLGAHIEPLPLGLEIGEDAVAAAVERLHRLLQRLLLERDQIAGFCVEINALEGTPRCSRSASRHHLDDLSGSEIDNGDEYDPFRNGGLCEGGLCEEDDYESDLAGGYEDGGDLMELMAVRNIWAEGCAAATAAG